MTVLTVTTCGVRYSQRRMQERIITTYPAFKSRLSQEVLQELSILLLSKQTAALKQLTVAQKYNAVTEGGDSVLLPDITYSRIVLLNGSRPQRCRVILSNHCCAILPPQCGVDLLAASTLQWCSLRHFGSTVWTASLLLHDADRLPPFLGVRCCS